MSLDAERSARYRANHPGVGARNSQRWRTRHPEGKAEYHRLQRYGLTVETYAAMVEAQCGRCAICGTDSPGHSTKCPVDHDHTCLNHRERDGGCPECIRGLLCPRCNQTVVPFLELYPDRQLDHERSYMVQRPILRYRAEGSA